MNKSDEKMDQFVFLNTEYFGKQMLFQKDTPT